VPRAVAIIASLTALPTPERLQTLAGLCEILEVRADLIGDVEAGRLREHFPGRLLYTLRGTAEGGSFDGGPEARAARILEGAEGYDLVDFERQDVAGGVVESIAPGRRLLSWHGRPESVEELATVAGELLATDACWYKLVTATDRSGPDRWPLALLHDLGRGDVIAFAGGEIGSWTRLLSLLLGAPAVFAAAGPRPAAAGQLAVETLHRDYQWPLADDVRWLLGVVGMPVAESLSPYLFNRALRRLGIPALYVPFQVQNFGEFWLEVVEEGGFPDAGCVLRGLSVTAPNKRLAMAIAGATSPLAEQIRSANTLVCHDGVWEADTTDPEGVLGPLRRRNIGLRGRPTAVLGAGGAGRAAAFALAHAGAEVRVFNRSAERGARVAKELDLPFSPWAELDPAGYSLVVHATPLGRSAEDPLPCAVDTLPADAVGLDLAYLRDRPTPWVEALRSAGRVAIDGREALLHQAIPQFAAMTGREMPSDLVAEQLAEWGGE